MPSREEFSAAIKADLQNPDLRRIYADWLEEQGWAVEAARIRMGAAKLEYKLAVGPDDGSPWKSMTGWESLGYQPTVGPDHPDVKHLSRFYRRRNRSWEQIFPGYPPWLVAIKFRVWAKMVRLAGMNQGHRKVCPPTRENIIACRDALLARSLGYEAGRLSMGLVTKEEQQAVKEKLQRLRKAYSDSKKVYMTLKTATATPPNVEDE